MYNKKTIEICLSTSIIFEIEAFIYLKDNFSNEPVLI